MDAVVESVNLSATKGVPKYPQPTIEFTLLGVAGDSHAGATRWSTSRRREEPNERSVTVVGAEALEHLNAVLGIALKAGDLAENLLVRGLGDLSDLVDGDRILVDGGAGRVTLRVTGQNMPCKALLPYHPHMVKTAYEKLPDGSFTNRRGVLCVVERVDGDGRVAAGARVTLGRASG